MRLARLTSALLSVLLAVSSSVAVDDCPNNDVFDTTHLSDIGAELVFVVDKSLPAEHLALVARLYQLISCFFDQPKTDKTVVRSTVVDQSGAVVIPLLARSRAELNAVHEDVSKRSSLLHDNQSASIRCDSAEQVARRLDPLLRPTALKLLIMVDNRQTRRACPLLSAAAVPIGWRVAPILINGDVSSATNSVLHFTDWTNLRRIETESDSNQQLLKSREWNAFDKLKGVRRFARDLIDLPPQKSNRSSAQQSNKPDGRTEPSSLTTSTLTSHTHSKHIKTTAAKAQDTTTSKEMKTTTETGGERPIKKPAEDATVKETTTKEPTDPTAASRANNASPVTNTTSSRIKSTTQQTTTNATTTEITTPYASTTTTAAPVVTTVDPKTTVISSIKPEESAESPPVTSTSSTGDTTTTIEESTATSITEAATTPERPTNTTSEARAEPPASRDDPPSQTEKPATSTPTSAPTSLGEEQPPSSTFAPDETSTARFPSSNETVTTNGTDVGNDTLDATTSAASSSGLAMWVVGVLIGAVALILLICVLIIIVVCRRRSRRKAGGTAPEEGGATAGEAEQGKLDAQSGANTVKTAVIQSAQNHLDSSLTSSSCTCRTVSVLSVGVTPVPSQPNVVAGDDFGSHTDLISDQPLGAPIDLSDHHQQPVQQSRSTDTTATHPLSTILSH